MVKIGRLSFDHVSYDAAGDVIYLHVGEPRAAAEAEETAEGTCSGTTRADGSSA